MSVSQEFEPYLDEFIKNNPETEMKKSKSKNFSGSMDMITLVTIVTPIIIPEITKLIGTLLEYYKEKNRHEEELFKASMAQITITQKHDDFDSEIILHIKEGERNPKVQELLKQCIEEIKPDEE